MYATCLNSALSAKGPLRQIPAVGLTHLFVCYCLLFRERDDHIQKLSVLQKQQAHQAEQALEDFKSQVERNSGRMFDEMKSQVCEDRIGIFKTCYNPINVVSSPTSQNHCASNSSRPSCYRVLKCDVIILQTFPFEPLNLVMRYTQLL